ncbi:MAG: tetratricopeptide repeat protein [Eubacterium sp.]|nr:tetratricopeptide repeat protein [Eubacterium sp.]
MDNGNNKNEFSRGGRWKDRFSAGQLPSIPAPAFLIAAAVLLLLAALILVPWLQNLAYSIQIRKGPAESATEQKLARGGLSDRYVPNYNLGHSAYQEGDYDKAIDYYDQALSYKPKWHRECPIRINLTLSMLREIDYSDSSQATIDALKEARAVLCAEGCADPNGKPGKGGHNKDAIKLRDEIDKVLEEMDQQKDQNKDDQEDDQDNKEEEKSGGQSKQQSGKEKSIQNQLEEEQKKAQQQYNQDRQEQRQRQQMQRASEDGGDGDDEEGSGGGYEQAKQPW